MGGIKVTKQDRIFSRYIRERDGWTCQRCKTRYTPPTNALHCAHMFTRGKWSTRLDPRNAVALCYGCHQHMDSHPCLKAQFFRRRLGDVEFEALKLASNTPTKKALVIERFEEWTKGNNGER